SADRRRPPGPLEPASRPERAAAPVDTFADTGSAWRAIPTIPEPIAMVWITCAPDAKTMRRRGVDAVDPAGSGCGGSAGDPDDRRGGGGGHRDRPRGRLRDAGARRRAG